MKNFLSFAKQALYIAGRVVAAGVLPAIGTYYWTLTNHHNYWNRTIFAVQTIDFNILANTLPTKLSTLIIQKNTEEIQRTLQSNTGRFGIVVTDCKIADKECPNQTVVYRTQSRSSWSRNFSMDLLKDAPFDVLRDPPPLKTEINFPELRSTEYRRTGQTNSGKIIGRVYYVRGIPPSYLDSWGAWLKDSSTGVGSIYTTSVSTFFAVWVVLILLVEIAIHKINAKKQQNQQLWRDLEELKEKNTVILRDKSKVLADLRKAEDEKQSLLEYLQHSVDDAEKLQASLEAAKVIISQQQTELKQKLDESAQRLTSYEQELQANTEHIEELQKSLTSHQENLVPQAEIDAYQQKLYEANSNQDRLHHLIESQNQGIYLKQQELQSLSEEKIDLETKLDGAVDELNTNKIRVSRLETDLKELEDSIGKIQADKDRSENQAQELQQRLDSLLIDTKKSEANLQQLLEQVKKDGDSLVEIYEEELRKKENALISTKDFYVKYAEDLEQEIARLKSEKQDIECDLISARSDRDYFGSQNPEIAEIPLVDISSLYIGFVGGESRTMNKVITRLQKDHGLINYRLLAGGYDQNQNMNQNVFRASLQSCNLIVFISVYVGHPYWYMLKNLQSTGAITQNLFIINLRGESGIVREIVNYSQNLNMREAA
jgi:hypothetical protein